MTARLGALRLYPVKSCSGIELDSAVLSETGLQSGGIGDREWVVVDRNGRFLSQRTLPRMALIGTRVGGALLRLTAPGMPLLEIRPAEGGQPERVGIWRDFVDALDQGAVPADWFSEFLQADCRLMRFDPRTRRRSDPNRTGGADATLRFADAFALLVVSRASVDDLNRRLAERGAPTIGIERFRPNLVLDGIGPYEEDYVRELRIGPVTIRPAGRCTRCTVPGVDPATGRFAPQVPDMLAGYRGAPEGVLFGINAIPVEGIGTTMTAGDTVEVELDL